MKLAGLKELMSVELTVLIMVATWVRDLVAWSVAMTVVEMVYLMAGWKVTYWAGAMDNLKVDAWAVVLVSLLE